MSDGPSPQGGAPGPVESKPAPATPAGARPGRSGLLWRLPWKLPLLAQIIGWFFLNLVLLAAGAWLFVRSELRLGPLLAGLATQRALPAVETMVIELRDRPRADWDAMLERFGQVYGVELLLLHGNGGRLAGPAITLPEPVRARMQAREGLRGEPPPSGSRPPPEELRRRPQTPVFLHTSAPSCYWLLLEAPLPDPDEHRPLRLAIRSESLGAGGLFFDFRPWLWAGSAVMVLSVLWWIPFVRSITRALSRVTAATEQIAGGRFEVALDEGRGDELGRLAGAINRMSSRLVHFVTGQKRFLGDIAHELCAPLSRMQLAIGVLEQRADERQREYVEDVREELQHMSALVNELLSFSRAGITGREVPLSSVPLRPLVDRVLARESLPADRARITVPPELAVLAEPELLARCLGNLVRNALRHAGTADGPVEISARPHDGWVEISVADHGPGVPPESLDRIFEPFYRVDVSRQRETGGVGLGLAIVKTCIQACGGRVSARNREPHGLDVLLVLARARDSVPPE